MSKTETRSGIVIFDLDGCLFDDSWRLHLIESQLEFAISSDDARFDAYHAQAAHDVVNEVGKKHLDDALANGMYICFVTARPIRYQRETIDQITSALCLRMGYDFALYMRPTGDHRSAPEIKLEVASGLLAEVALKGVGIVGAFDDRQDVIDAYLSLGIPAFVLNLQGCYAPLLQTVTPSVLAKFQQAMEEAAPVVPVEPEPFSNEHPAPVNLLGAPTSAPEPAPADGPTQPNAPEPVLACAVAPVFPFASASSGLYRVALALFPEGMPSINPASRNEWKAFEKIVTFVYELASCHLDSAAAAEELAYNADALDSLIANRKY